VKRAWPYLLLLLAAGLLLVALGREAPPPTGPAEPPASEASTTVPLVDPQGRFELSLPADWQVEWLETGPLRTEALRARAPGEPGVAVHVFYSRAPPLTLLRLYSSAVSLASTRGERIIDGRRAEEPVGLVVETETRVPREPPHEQGALVRFVSARGLLLQVRAEAPIGLFESSRPVLTAAVRSLRIPL